MNRLEDHGTYQPPLNPSPPHGLGCVVPVSAVHFCFSITQNNQTPAQNLNQANPSPVRQPNMTRSIHELAGHKELIAQT
jgi:hypothetical protein